MKRLITMAVVALLPEALPSQQLVDVALYPLTITERRDTTLTRLADSCITLLGGRLPAIGVTVVRRSGIPPQDLSQVPWARLVMVGTLGRADAAFDVELQLVDVGTGDELRSYLYRGPDASKVIGLGLAAAERIKAVVLAHRK
jgi:hypothetical protein